MFLNFKKQKIKLDSGKEKIESDQNILQKSDDLSNVKFIQKSSDNGNVTKVCHNHIIIYCFTRLFLKSYLFY